MRWLALAVIAVLCGIGLVLALSGGTGDETRDTSVAAPPRKPPPPPELPRGGRSIFPEHRVVAFYGAPQAAGLGILGIGPPARAARKLERVARRYRRPGRPVLPALELISTVAAGASHDGRYSYRQSPATIRRYLRAAREAKALLLLDVQPGRVDFMAEVKRLRPFLVEPDVGLALDPEWHVGPGQVPGQSLGSMDAADADRAARYLAGIVRRGRLPQKLLLVHQFTESMVRNRRKLRPRPGVAVALNVDGFGAPADKIGAYTRISPPGRRVRHGFKLFYEEDEGLMSPSEVLRLRPRPDVVVYE